MKSRKRLSRVSEQVARTRGRWGLGVALALAGLPAAAQPGIPVALAGSTPAPPTAHAAASPEAGPAPLTVVLDGTGSTAATPEALPLALRWDAGDGSPAAAGERVEHTYPVPGGYLARLEVRDGYGGKGEAWTPVHVKDAAGHRPPSARIKASSLRGRDALRVDFACECAPGDAALVAYRWELGNGTVDFEEEGRAEYGPGRYHARLTVVDANGLAAWDEVEVVVTRGEREPPECSAAASPPAGAAPLDVVWTAHAVAPAGTVARTEWTLDGWETATGPTAGTVRDAPGWYGAELVVEDDAGLLCTDRAEVAVLGAAGEVPPRIVSEPEQAARCGVEYRYAGDGPRALGPGPLAWSAPVAPHGFTVNAQDGSVRWLPTPAQRGTRQVMLEARSAAGSAIQVFTVEVECPDALGFRTEGGCGSAGGALASPVLLLLAAALRDRRGRTAHAGGRPRRPAVRGTRAGRGGARRLAAGRVAGAARWARLRAHPRE